MRKFHLDFETRSAIDIKTAGAWKYAMHPSTEILCMAWSIDGKTVGVLTQKQIEGVRPNLPADVQIIAHNSHFEYAVYHSILHRKYGWPALWDPKHWGCTLSRAAACNLPISLLNAGAALNIPTQKDWEGRAAMLKLCKPTGFDPFGDPLFITEAQRPDLYHTLYEYCKIDVVAEMELDRQLPELSPAERSVWELDLIINRRGVQADVATARRAMFLAAKTTNELNEKLYKLTGGFVSKATRLAEMKKYLEMSGVKDVESLDKAAVIALLEREDVPQNAKDVVKVRQQAGKSSTAKYEAILNVAHDGDKRMRGLLQYHAAGTGRWAGRLVQPQNFPKGIGYDAPEVVEDLQKGEEFFVEKHGDKVMDALSAGLRGVLTAGEGKVLVAADYSAIEARVLLWHADDGEALAKYRAGVNLYEDMARFIYNNPQIGKKTHPKEYALGKAAILGCGYGMGAEKFRATCADQYGIEISAEMAETAIKTYREKYNKVVGFWYAQEAAAMKAIRTPGSVHQCGKVTWGMSSCRRFLVCVLPSGRPLYYYRPSVKRIDSRFGEKDEMHYWCAGINGQLAEFKTYGGSLVENIVQATARDIMANGMLNAEREGFPVVLTVHDELVTEIPDNTRYELGEQGESPEKVLESIMCKLPPWAAGLPVAAEGWTGFRYRK